MSALSRRAAFGAAAGATVAGVVSCQPVPAATSCPAAEIGHRLARLVEQKHVADCVALDAGPGDKQAAWARFDAVTDEVERHLAALSHVQATSLPGAMVQAMAASNVVTGWGLPAELEAKFSRLMLSVVTAAENLGGVPRETMAGDYCFARSLDAARCAARDADPSMGPDGEIVALGAEASALIAAHAEKDGAMGEWPEFDTDAEETAFARAWYTEIDRAHEIVDTICGMRAVTLVGASVKSRLARRLLGKTGDGEAADSLARSVCRDVECGLMRIREA